MTRLEGLIFLLPFLRAEHTCCLTAAILDFAKGAFFEANRGKNQTLYLYLPELLICVKGITEVVFYFVFSFTVKEGSKKGLKKEQRPIANRQLLYQLSLKPHFCLMVLPLHIGLVYGYLILNIFVCVCGGECCIITMISVTTIIIQIQAVRTSLFLSTFSSWRHEERDTILKGLC